ncbi:hypothetical protein BG015_011986 [Linnemannia schmuckeri]|uniref:Uncharacterized protein n=1 Tax=Linnemannia schmuckeri TaxID=64567 RepID=A0A9P5RS87_9FUNG|nr:hypothetical protein BG015_011986 [Linnemannia schmuckeri]
MGDDIQQLVLDEDEKAWKAAVEKDPIEQAHIRRLIAQTVGDFLNKSCKDEESIAEIVLLGSIMKRSDFGRVLSFLVKQME